MKIYDSYPDTDAEKEVKVFMETQTMGEERHIYVGWLNDETPSVEQAWQQVHLSGGPGNYSFYPCTAALLSQQSFSHKKDFSLGLFSRKQRDGMVEIAKTVPFVKKSYSDNCQTWMSKFLSELAQHGIITKEMSEEALLATLGS